MKCTFELARFDRRAVKLRRRVNRAGGTRRDVEHFNPEDKAVNPPDSEANPVAQLQARDQVAADSIGRRRLASPIVDGDPERVGSAGSSPPV